MESFQLVLYKNGSLFADFLGYGDDGSGLDYGFYPNAFGLQPNLEFNLTGQVSFPAREDIVVNFNGFLEDGVAPSNNPATFLYSEYAYNEYIFTREMLLTPNDSIISQAFYDVLYTMWSNLGSPLLGLSLSGSDAIECFIDDGSGPWARLSSDSGQLKKLNFFFVEDRKDPPLLATMTNNDFLSVPFSSLCEYYKYNNYVITKAMLLTLNDSEISAEMLQVLTDIFNDMGGRAAFTMLGVVPTMSLNGKLLVLNGQLCMFSSPPPPVPPVELTSGILLWAGGVPANNLVMSPDSNNLYCTFANNSPSSITLVDDQTYSASEDYELDTISYLPVSHSISLINSGNVLDLTTNMRSIGLVKSATGSAQILHIDDGMNLYVWDELTSQWINQSSFDMTTGDGLIADYIGAFSSPEGVTVLARYDSLNDLRIISMYYEGELFNIDTPVVQGNNYYSWCLFANGKIYVADFDDLSSTVKVWDYGTYGATGGSWTSLLSHNNSTESYVSILNNNCLYFGFDGDDVSGVSIIDNNTPFSFPECSVLKFDVSTGAISSIGTLTMADDTPWLNDIAQNTTTGEIYFAGYFTGITDANSNSITANGIATYNPTSNTWSAVTDIFNGGAEDINEVMRAAISPENDILYLSGYFPVVNNSSEIVVSLVRIVL